MTNRMSSRVALSILAGMLAAGTMPATAQTLPPERMNYQGVLRDQNGNPLTGTYDMVFRFMDAVTGGNEILVDGHTAANSNAVIVAGGLLDVGLGTGTISDGSGPGTYTLLSGVFKDYTNVWLEIQVGAETLSPRTQIHSAPYALNASNLGGHPAGYFLDTSSTTQQKSGRLIIDTPSPGATAGRFVATGNASRGVFSRAETGGRFENDSPGFVGRANVATIDSGIDGFGGLYGGRFIASNNLDGSVGVEARGEEYGIDALGYTAGGFFRGASSATATLAWINTGAYFTSAGMPPLQKNVTLASQGYAVDANGPAHFQYLAHDVALASPFFAVDGIGPARFQNGGFSASLLDADIGIQAGGPSRGGYLYNGSPNFSYAYIPNGDRGITAWGSVVGGDFHNFSSAAWAYVGYSTYKIFGSGSVSFVQNHPQDPSKVIVYAAPEGDEVAVYTRGSGRLVDGEARVALGGTFALVTNPDIGLTATATPRREPIPLAVKQVSPAELVVQGPEGSDAEFDYMVWGLRIGFEEQSIVQPKKEEAKIPSMHMHAQYFQDEPALREHTALARFQGIEESVRGKKQLDFTHAEQLRAAIGVSPKGEPAPPAEAPGPRRDVPAASHRPSAEGAPVAAEQGPVGTQGAPVGGDSGAAEAGNGGTLRAVSQGVDLFQTAERIEPGDVVSLAADAPGHVVRSAGPDDTLLIGCAQPVETDPGTVAVASSRIALCRVDASNGPVSIGDRLTASPVAGMAMKVSADTAAAQVLGRALEPLEAGTDLVRVLVGVK